MHDLAPITPTDRGPEIALTSRCRVEEGDILAAREDELVLGGRPGPLGVTAHGCEPSQRATHSVGNPEAAAIGSVTSPERDPLVIG